MTSADRFSADLESDRLATRREPDEQGDAILTERPDTQDAPVGAGERRARRRRSARRNAIEWTLVIVGALIVAFTIKTFLIQAFYIPSPSMMPTLRNGDRVLVNKMSYRLHDVHRGDIIVFERPDEAGPSDIDDLIKRVIALPGEEVEAKDGQVYIDDEPLDEAYLADGVTTPPFQAPECSPSCVVPPDHVFVLGDNRSNSEASNAWGPLDEDRIIGRAFVRVWPLGDFGTL